MAITRKAELSLKTCYKCGAQWVSQHRIPGRTETCIRCEYYLHCCLNCALFDAFAPQQCKSPTVELVQDKEKANFCDEFEFADREVQRGPEPREEKSREDWKKLFGD